MSVLPRPTLSARVLHAVLYEVCAMALLVPLGSMLLGHNLGHLGLLALLLSALAMLWNMLFNALFERLEHRRQWQRTWRVRSLHALGFEGGLVVLSVPLVAGWLEIGYWAALLVDIGVMGFFLPYTYVFNWGYDQLRARWHRQQAGKPG